MISKVKISLAAILLSGLCFGQTAKVLRLKEKRFYKEENTLSIDKAVHLKQQVCYNEPGTIDEEYCIILNLTITDTLKARQLKTIDLTKDSSIIKCSWDWLSVWNWEGEDPVFSGSVTILSWTGESLKIDLAIEVVDNRHKRKYSYKGRRRFSKTKDTTQADDDD